LVIEIYAKYVDTKIIKSDPKKATPAKMFMDGVEFMPTSKNILFGYQFKSIAGAAPVIGPILAIQWDGSLHCCGYASVLYLLVGFMTTRALWSPCEMKGLPSED